MSSWADVFPLCNHQTGCKIIYDACHERGIYPAFNDPQEMYLKPKYHDYWSNPTHGCYYLDQAIINAIPNFYRQPFTLVDPVITKDYLTQSDIEAIKQQYSPEKYTLETMLEDLKEDYIPYNNLSIRYSSDWAMQRARMLNLMTHSYLLYYYTTLGLKLTYKHIARIASNVPWLELKNYKNYLGAWNDNPDYSESFDTLHMQTHVLSYKLPWYHYLDYHNVNITYDIPRIIVNNPSPISFNLIQCFLLTQGGPNYSYYPVYFPPDYFGNANSNISSSNFLFRDFGGFNASAFSWKMVNYHVGKNFQGDVPLIIDENTEEPLMIDPTTIFEWQDYGVRSISGFLAFDSLYIVDLTPGLQYYDPPVENI